MEGYFLENSKTKIDNKHILTMFTYRYVFDQKNDIVDLRQDVLDLAQFPERLTGSYSCEWEKYNRKAMYEKKIEAGDDKLKELLINLSFEKRKELEYLLCVVEKTILVLASSNIIVIKSELKSYIENLLKI
jgi:hypothetical protein